MRAFVLGLVLVIAGCGAASPQADARRVDAGSSDAALPADDGSGGSDEPTPDAGMARFGCDKIDVLFVIDNSPSMTDEQVNLAASFPGFVAALADFRDGKVDYRVGVTTTAFPQSVWLFQTVGEEGALLQTTEMSQRWLSSSDPDLIPKFERLATVGTDGSGDEQPLRAARAALIDRVEDGTNRGFFREDALLAMVLITDEDDQSVEDGGGFEDDPIPVSDFVASFDAVKGARSAWAVAIVAGDRAPYCTSAFGEAQYAAKLLDFAQQAGRNARFASICDGDLAKSLRDALETFAFACDNYVI